MEGVVKKLVRLLSIVSAVLMGSILLAGQNGETPERVIVNPKPHKKHAKKQSCGSAAVRAAEKQEKSPAGNVWVSTSPKHVYILKNVGSKGKTLTTLDETIWEISSMDAPKLAYWAPNSPIIIMPNYSWFSAYDYMLHNQWTNESVKANLSQGPFVKHATFIQQIDSRSGYVKLSNGSVWTVNRSREVDNWRPGQAVLIGENDTWMGKPNILININENNFATVAPH